MIVLKNFHRFLQNAEIAQTLHNLLATGKQSRLFLVVLAPVVQVPIELEKLFVIVEHDLPTREQLLDLARGVATEDGDLPSGPPLDALLDAAAGLTRYEAESAFSLSLVRHNALTHLTVAFELSYCVLIWNRWTRPLVLLGAICLHLGIVFALGMPTFGLVMLIANIAFISPTFIRTLVDGPVRFDSSGSSAPTPRAPHFDRRPSESTTQRRLAR